MLQLTCLLICITVLGSDLCSQVPGVYNFDAAVTLDGILTLSGSGTYVFQVRDPQRGRLSREVADIEIRLLARYDTHNNCWFQRCSHQWSIGLRCLLDRWDCCDHWHEHNFCRQHLDLNCHHSYDRCVCAGRSLCRICCHPRHQRHYCL